MSSSQALSYNSTYEHLTRPKGQKSYIELLGEPENEAIMAHHYFSGSSSYYI